MAIAAINRTDVHSPDFSSGVTPTEPTEKLDSTESNGDIRSLLLQIVELLHRLQEMLGGEASDSGSESAGTDPANQDWIDAYNDRLERMQQTQDPALRQHYQHELDAMRPTMDVLGCPIPGQSGSSALPGGSGRPDQSTGGEYPDSSGVPGLSGVPPADSEPVPDVPPGETIKVNGGGPTSYTFANNSSRVHKLGFMDDPTKPMATVTLQPGESATFSIADGESAYFATADSDGVFQPNAARFEVFSEGGLSNVNISYVVGRNASYKVSDGQGMTLGDNKPIAAGAPSNAVVYDAAGNPTIIGWYDGSTAAMDAGGAYMEQMLGTAGAYIRPHDDQLPDDMNPMRMAQNTSTHFTISIGNA